MGLIGRVTADREARIPLRVRSGEGTERDVDAVIDTGFNGVLGLPTRLIEELGLARVGRERMLLANGEFHFARIYRAIVDLEDRAYSVRAVEAGEPLAGMGLLWEHELCIQCIDGGQVDLERLS
ncbi:putative aspartyl protease [Salinibacter ruber]|jgi:predicted aspartyl protease|uniref:clan AA aspartic protease n=1 Tax=Salinibacter ruber TaxID=146919 RepID=UPI000E56B772|nr:clan AA aspartic protease [Salinibacter ruber]MCS3705917.1 putative aspartyl protease [Salinibacter ruber]